MLFGHHVVVIVESNPTFLLLQTVDKEHQQQFDLAQNRFTGLTSVEISLLQ